MMSLYEPPPTMEANDVMNLAGGGEVNGSAYGYLMSQTSGTYDPSSQHPVTSGNLSDLTQRELYDSDGAIVFIIIVILFYGLSIPCLIGLFISSKKENVPFEHRDYLKEINKVRAVAMRTERLRLMRRAIKHRGSLAAYSDSPSIMFARTTLGSSSSEQSITPTVLHPPANPLSSIPGGAQGVIRGSPGMQGRKERGGRTLPRLNIINEDPLQEGLATAEDGEIRNDGVAEGTETSVVEDCVFSSDAREDSGLPSLGDDELSTPQWEGGDDDDDNMTPGEGYLTPAEGYLTPGEEDEEEDAGFSRADNDDDEDDEDEDDDDQDNNGDDEMTPESTDDTNGGSVSGSGGSVNGEEEEEETDAQLCMGRGRKYLPLDQVFYEVEV